ncbi:HepT-like ribonuclease domain-containing protein [Olivibacter sitiensis]
MAFRNLLVHAYDSVDDTIVWAVIKTHLHEEVRFVLEQD